MPQKTSYAELARRLKVSRKRIASAIERGEVSPQCLGKDGAGRVVILDADRFEAELRPLVETVANPGEAPPLIDPDAIDFEDPDSWPKDLNGLRVVREWWVARHAKRKDDLAAGELVRVEEVQREAFQVARELRDAVLQVPSRVADDLAVEGDTHVIRERLHAELARPLADFERGLKADQVDDQVEAE